MRNGQDDASKIELTQLLRAWGAGEKSALEKLTPLVYSELRRIARRYMAQERPDHTLQATALVHEAYVRLIDVHGVSWQNRAHFFALSAQMMRRILTDMARSRNNRKRGGPIQPISLEVAGEVAGDAAMAKADKLDADITALNEALDRLAAIDSRKGQVVELRYFGGLTIEEAAEVAGVSPETVKLDWKFAKAWLRRELRPRT
jgi:RNA polymerase sigma factor (TIGR02999 family)